MTLRGRRLQQNRICRRAATARAVLRLAPLLAFAAWLPGAAAASSLDWKAIPGGRAAGLSIPVGGKTGFTLVSGSQSGVTFTNTLSFARSSANQNLLNGSGVAAGDFDGDGWCDLFFANLEGSSALYRNLGGWKFENVTAAAGVGCTNQNSTGAVFADLNSDGRLDLLVNSCGGPNACFLNLGNGQFTNITAAAGLVSRMGSSSLALADVEGDGDLDLYVVNYRENTIRSGASISTRMVNGREVVVGRQANRARIIDGKLMEFGEPDALYLNDGKAKFSPVSWTGGSFLNREGKPLAALLWDMGLSGIFRDLNGDRAPELYICNDFQNPDRFWINDGKGRFRIAPDAVLRSMSHFSMTADAADINRDGKMDFFVGDMKRRSHVMRMRQIAPDPIPNVPGEFEARPQFRKNTLFLNRGDGTFDEIAAFAGLDASDWTWCVAFLDVDLDGYEDVLVTTGHAFDAEDIEAVQQARSLAAQPGSVTMRASLQLYPPLQTPNLLFRNRGDLTFEEMGAQWGFNSTHVSHGLAFADLDNDGDLDAAANCLNAPALLYRNDAAAPRVAVRLRGEAGNTQGIGAKITLAAPGLPAQSQEIVSGGRYLSGDDPARTFAASSGPMTLEVLWRSGRKSVLSAASNMIYEVAESQASAVEPASAPAAAAPWFEEIPLPHQHQDEPFDDFARQPLLPRKLSQNGPGAAWIDLDGDNNEELVIGSGRGGRTTVLRQEQGKWSAHPEGQALPDDLAGFALGLSSRGEPRLLASLSRYQQAEAGARPRLLEYRWSGGLASAEAALPDFPDSGPIALADLDGDGDLDLFAGGQALPGAYPESSPARIYRNESGAWRLDAASNLSSARLVNGAVWSDLDLDGRPELVLACEWGPVRVFSWKSGACQEITQPLGLGAHTGFWQGVTAGDFNGDGRMDLVAGNWGLNTEYDRRSWQLCYGDWDKNGSVETVLAFIDSETRKLVPHLNLLQMDGLGWIFGGKTWTPKTFGAASLPEILGPFFRESKTLAANTLASTVFLNEGGKFRAVALPAEAQFTPVFGLSVCDFDGDGREDLFLAQNFKAVRPGAPECAGGRGLLLLGDGQGGFRPMQDPGLQILGEQRGAAVADFDGDGRADLAVAQNRGPARLYRNVKARPGVRVSIQGPPENPLGIGTILRLKSASGLGPAREIHSSSGWLSADSAAPVLAAPAHPAMLETQWPNGKRSTHPIPAEATALVIKAD